MAGIEEVDLGIGEVAQVGAGPRLGEEGVVAAPNDEGGRLLLAQPLLPGRVELDVAVVVQRQGDLRLLAARLVEEVLVEGPPVGGDQLRRTGALLVLPAGHGQLQEPPDVSFGARDSGAVGDHLPGQGRQALAVGVGVLRDQAGDPLRVPGRQPEADRPAEVEDVHHEPVQP